VLAADILRRQPKFSLAHVARAYEPPAHQAHSSFVKRASPDDARVQQIDAHFGLMQPRREPSLARRFDRAMNGSSAKIAPGWKRAANERPIRLGISSSGRPRPFLVGDARLY
jgi:hypothetical protein